jgi:ribosomal protein L14E/L6E/L27E
VDHLEPTAETVELKKGAADDEVEKALTKGKKTKFMKEDALPGKARAA